MIPLMYITHIKFDERLDSTNRSIDELRHKNLPIALILDENGNEKEVRNPHSGSFETCNFKPYVTNPGIIVILIQGVSYKEWLLDLHGVGLGPELVEV